MKLTLPRLIELPQTSYELAEPPKPAAGQKLSDRPVLSLEERHGTAPSDAAETRRSESPLREAVPAGRPLFLQEADGSWSWLPAALSAPTPDAASLSARSRAAASPHAAGNLDSPPDSAVRALALPNSLQRDASPDPLADLDGPPDAAVPAMALPASMRLDELPPLPAGCPWLLLLGDDGEPCGCVSAAAALEELRQSFRRLRAGFEATLETVDSAITVINADSEVIAWTGEAERMFGIRREEIMGHPADAFFQKERLQVLRALTTGEVLRAAQHQPRPDMHAVIHARPIELGGERIGAVAAEQDITSQIRLNQQLFRMTAKMQHLERKVERLDPSGADPFSAIRGGSPAVRASVETARKLASAKAPVLLLGESGVGKELYARAIHDAGPGPDAPFIAINCGAISPTLFESELFGYERGAFSGADPRGRKGKLDLAAGGTLLLDEVGEMPLELQVKLLRVLQERTFYAVGGTTLRRADCRILAATNRDLLAMIADGRFREDLYYRLSVVTLDIPPLRERTGDVYELLPAFLSEFALLYGRFIEACPHEVVQRLAAYDWPGNIRELRGAAERLVLLATDGVIRMEHLPPRLLQEMGREGTLVKEGAPPAAAPVRSWTGAPPAPAEAASGGPVSGGPSPGGSVSGGPAFGGPPPSGPAPGGPSLGGPVSGYGYGSHPLPPARWPDSPEDYERERIRRLLEAERGNKKAVARQLGISRATLYNRMKKLGMPL
ncbi:sigma 54-interacting transcriptional regulator [Paenibacillus albicereus]|uniref:Sigma 54-interacting transcriptional regulator n=1 Tax=Paenibacillus albicereus TaxID=2726185 RepID=A0A6H2H2X6_9BACL|nr:sigma 54-interacting transcriptional regulator [Paenibacillus albicereus]QJC53985.1 sigma 54-interacting transcriptional regulator [Paenibacillus albicereus]